ncbi:MAG: bleomycin resistance protein [Actinobacteria bacterium]|nr:MAG: bleomycin resistance protein [Actinomycetota bacterium]
MILRIDHVGVATDDPLALEPYLTALGMQRTDTGVAEHYGVSCDFWQYGSGPAEPAVELVAPAREDSSVHGRLARSGPGLYHIAFVVDDIDRELERLRTHGFVAVDPQPCNGARPGMRVAFMYLRRPAGMLIELVEYAGREESPW